MNFNRKKGNKLDKFCDFLKLRRVKLILLILKREKVILMFLKGIHGIPLWDKSGIRFQSIKIATHIDEGKN